MVENILPKDTPLTQGVGSKGQTIYFSESSHVAYQIKADDAGSNMVANILPTDTPSFLLIPSTKIAQMVLLGITKGPPELQIRNVFKQYLLLNHWSKSHII